MNQPTDTSIATPVLSAEIFIIPLEAEKWIVYAPLRMAAFITNAATVNFLADLQQGIYSPDIDKDGSLVEFLRRLEILDAGSEDKPITIFGGDPEPTDVTLFLTTACNLRCTYCYASAGDTPVRTMPLNVAKRGLDFVISNAVRKRCSAIEIAYHGGGEPTVNWKTLTASYDYACAKSKPKDIKVIASTATNGVLTDTQIDWIVANLKGVSLSIDGSPHVQDRNRPLASGKGSSERVIHTLKRFDEAGFSYGLRVTATKDQISELEESVDYLCANFSAVRIQVEPAYQMGRWKNAPSAETDEFITAYRKAQNRAAQYDKEIYYSAARVGMLTNHFCGITQDSFALSPDGNVSACYEVFSEDNDWAKVFFYGKNDQGSDGYTFDINKLEHLRHQAVQHRDYCKGCYAKWTCAGDCYHKSLTVNGKSEFQGSDRCHITREFTKDQILAKIVASGGIFWHEQQPVQSPTASGKEILV